jgi:hypothetical protein
VDANEMKYQFFVLYDQIASQGAPGYTDREIGVLLSKAEEIIVVEKYDNEDERGRKNFSELKRHENIITTSSSQTGIRDANGVFYDLPTDCLYILSENATVSSSDTCVNNTKLNIVPVTEDEYTINKSNPFQKPFAEYGDGEIWRLDFSRETVGTNPKRVELITDGTFSVSTYHLRYLRRPQGITPFTGDSSTTAQVDSELDEIVHRAIVDKAVRIATSTTKPQEYQIKLNEEQINEQ